MPDQTLPQVYSMNLKFLTVTAISLSTLLSPSAATADLINLGTSESGQTVYVDDNYYRQGDTILFWFGLKTPIKQDFYKVVANCNRGEYQFIEPIRSEMRPARYGSVAATAIDYVCRD